MNVIKKLAKISIAVISTNFIAGCAPEKSLETHGKIENGVFINYAAILQKQGISTSSIIQADKIMRVKVMQGIKEAILNQYSLIHLKEKRILTANGSPFNTNEHLNNCIAIESKVEDTSDLHFIDRIKQCIAGFQDTHLRVWARVETPSISTGILIREIDGKYVIYGRDEELLNYIKSMNDDDELDDVTAIGNEVIEIDGQSPTDLSKHYAAFARGSSESFRRLIGDLNIFYRDFEYPTKNFVEIKVKSPKKTHRYKLPWLASINTSKRLDAKEYFDHLSIPTTARVKMLYTKDSRIDWRTVNTTYKGYSESASLVKTDPFSPLVNFFTEDDQKTLAARMGVINTSGIGFCYLQLLTFSAKYLVSENDNSKVKYVPRVKEFVNYCKEKNLDLVMDLRSNGGGFGSYPYQILSLIAQPGTELGGKVIAYRANQASARLIASTIEHPELNSGDLDDIDERSLAEIKRVLPLKQLMTGILPVSMNIIPDADIGGFNGKVIALITPQCVSACDGMAALLKRSKRGVLIGTHTNGTGAGFMSSSDINSLYRDSFLEIEMKIPNYQFGYSAHPFSSLNSFDFDSNVDEYFTENRPTIADIEHRTQLSDILEKKNTWLEAVVKELTNSSMQDN